MKLAVFIPCVPPKTTAQQKGAFVLGGKVKFYTTKKVAQAGNDLCSLLAPHRPSLPFEGPLIIDIVMVYPWRKTESKRTRLSGCLPIPVKPDVDNLTKMFMDALTRCAFWTDDSLVSDLRIRKVWGDSTGIALRIEEISSILLPSWIESCLLTIKQEAVEEETDPFSDFFGLEE